MKLALLVLISCELARASLAVSEANNTVKVEVSYDKNSNNYYANL